MLLRYHLISFPSSNSDGWSTCTSSFLTVFPSFHLPFLQLVHSSNHALLIFHTAPHAPPAIPTVPGLSRPGSHNFLTTLLSINIKATVDRASSSTAQSPPAQNFPKVRPGRPRHHYYPADRLRHLRRTRRMASLP